VISRQFMRRKNDLGMAAPLRCTRYTGPGNYSSPY
jgi:hypothetical protein